MEKGIAGLGNLCGSDATTCAPPEIPAPTERNPLKTPLADRLCHGAGEAQQLGEVVEAEQDAPQQFLAADQVVEVGAAVVGAGRAGAAGIERGVVVAEAGIAQVPALASHQCGAVPAQPGRQHAVEQINPLRYRDRHFAVAAHPHQITRPVVRQQRRHLAHDAMHRLHRFAHAHPTDGDAGQAHRRHRPRRFFAQVGMGAPCTMPNRA